MQKETDVLVVGAGPAGSIAAKILAENGIKVILVDKKSEIGTPKRCAEGILKSTLTEFDIIADERWISNDVTGLKLIAPNNRELKFNEDNFDLPDTAYILERKVFDKHLAMDAARNGAEIMIKSEVTNLERSSTGFTVTLRNMSGENRIEAKIVIAADGPESRIAKMAGLKTNYAINDLASCVQYEMVNVDIEDSSQVEVYIGSRVPGGYIWIFPKGKDMANVGLGILKSHTDKTAKYFLDNFIKNNKIFADAQTVGINVGGDPICGLIKERYSDNIMVIGDAAGFVDPLTGDGIKTAMLSGKYAAEVAVKAIKNNDYSSDMLKEYYDVSEEEIGSDFNKYNKIKEFLLTLDDDSLNNIVENISKEDLSNLNILDLFKVIVKSSPKSLFNLRKLL